MTQLLDGGAAVDQAKGDGRTSLWIACHQGRVEAAQQLAALIPVADARALAPLLFGGSVSPSTAAAIAGAESPAQATALLLVAPEFQRR